MPFPQVMQAVRGDEGTQVTLEVDDGTPGGRRQVALTRERVDLHFIKVPANGSGPNPYGSRRGWREGLALKRCDFLKSA
jgi:C-terminal processing protease CtpA/Prc